MKKNPPVHSPAAVPEAGVVRIRGARQNNLKGFDLDLPLGRLNVISGPSGCGKSSLAFDTIYAEGQRRYVETFSPYTRQFMDRMDKPQVDEILGIPPAIAIEQANHVKSTRSTVGTMTEINDYLKLLFPLVAEASCPSCGRGIRPETAQSIVREIFAKCEGQAVLVTFGVPAPVGTKPAEFFDFLRQQGYLRAWLEGEVTRLDETPKLKRLPAVVQVIQDRVTVNEENRSRIAEAVETALRFGKGKLTLIPGAQASTLNAQLPFSSGWHCPHCDLEITPPSAGLFSFNHPLGACPDCKGFGRIITIDLERAIPNRSLSLKEGVVKPFQTENGQECQRDLLKAAARKEVDVNCPFEDLPEADQRWVLQGEPRGEGVSGEDLWKAGLWYGVKGFFTWLESKSYKMHVRVLLSRYRTYALCPTCNGGRFQSATLNFRVAGRTLPELMVMPAETLLPLLRHASGAVVDESGRDDSTREMLREAITSRLRYLIEVGLGYLSLDRPTRTLSGGEVERVNLTTCLGASLVNTLFVLDEPSVGLHPRDVGRLVKVMRELRDKGNTLLVVEHEEAVLRAADNLVELGPGRGEAGGELVFHGPLDAALKLKGGKSLTADYLSGRQQIEVPAVRRQPTAWIGVEGAKEHNLQNVDVQFPLGVFACITGVSGSGKSTLVHEVLYRNLLRARGEACEETPGACRRITGFDGVSGVVMVDQSPLARTPRSSVALYLGVFDYVREAFATSPAALAQGFTASAFSFNSGTGRCERCSGTGFEKIEMQFLSDLFVRCPECEGRRYQPHVLEVKLREKSIHDVLEMTVTQAIEFFSHDLRIAEPLGVLAELGLGYLRLGQPLNVLSGGESQRLKLVQHLTEGKQKGGALLIFDEPTTGLHFDDVAMLLKVFQRLAAQGNSLLVIEHNLEVIKCADYVIDLGPEAGSSGGTITAIGTPEEVAQVGESHTGRFLRSVLNRNHYDSLSAEQESLRVAEAPLSSFNPQPSTISIHGAREHNLKNISLQIPRDQMVVITGLSGSGKSTLAFDLLFAEGQRRFLDSMSPYARQFVEQLEKPDVDLISGLPPSVAIEQRVTRGGGKSTVATVTEVYHFLRLLFAKLGTQYCPKCDVAVEKQSLQSIVTKAEALAAKGKIRILAPLVKARKGFHTDVARWARRQGFEQLLVDGKWVWVDSFEKLERFREHTIDVLVGERNSPKHLREILKRALEIGRGTVRLMDAKNKVTVLSTEMSCPSCGDSFEELDPRLFSFNSPHGWCQGCRGFGEIWTAAVNDRAESQLEQELYEERQHEWLEEGEATPCPRCLGTRLNDAARHVRVGEWTIAQFVAQPVQAAQTMLGTWKFTGNQKLIARDLIPEIAQRLKFMMTVGLGYLSLDRSAMTLSGGESQRIRLSAQLGSNLRGVLYVLDEPTIGLHPRDNAALLDTLEALKQKGNSLVIVEHDEDTMRRADTIIDLGPGAGMNGGQVMAVGSLAEICKVKESVTARTLSNPVTHPLNGAWRALDKTTRWLTLSEATTNNLKNVTVDFPIGRFTAISGISGSGKSTLMRTLRDACRKALDKKSKLNVEAKLTGAEHLETLYEVDQSPIGKTSRSTPATYIKVFDEIRKLYAQMPLARMRGYTASRFSFNNAGGRCETCGGQGIIKIEMNFLPTSYLPCHDCNGKRYNPPTLEVLFNDKSIGDVMAMTMAEAADFFSAQPSIHRPLALLLDTGLGYLRLGQPSPTLSGGEAQRLKLVSELSRGVGRAQHSRLRKQREPKSTLYLLEEPTIGLHTADVRELLKVIHRLVDEGNTVVVIEHHIELIAEADYVVDIGPEAGAEGGQLVAAGPPNEIASHQTSRTAPFLRSVLRAVGGGKNHSHRRKNDKG